MRSVWLDTCPIPAAEDAFAPGASYDTVIAGAGLTGLTAAVLLSRAGQSVAVLEARRVGAVTTGHTTGKVSLLQGTTLSSIRRYHSDDVLRTYVDGNREGQAWLLRYLEHRDVHFQYRPAYTYATTDEGAAKLREELDAARAAELPVEWTTEAHLPFPITGALVLPLQAQIHAVEALAALRAEFLERGGTLVEGVRVTAAGRRPLTVETSRGPVHAERLILATGVPVLDRGGYFAKLEPHRSYALTYRLPTGTTDIPQAMYLSADEPSRTLRPVPLGDEELLLVGGNGHPAGRSSSPQAALDDLERWTSQYFPGAERTHAWSAQDYRSVDRVPFVGAMPRGGGRIYVATGYNKWGMTNAVAAALRLSSEILGGSTPWAEKMGRRVTKPAGVLSALRMNADVALEAGKGWTTAELRALPDEAPREGEGVIGRKAGRPVAVSTVDGTTCAVSGVCTHLGGVLRWNDAEKSWDCPLHGSRFAADGRLLEGPAVSDLAGSDSDETA